MLCCLCIGLGGLPVGVCRAETSWPSCISPARVWGDPRWNTEPGSFKIPLEFEVKKFVNTQLLLTKQEISSEWYLQLKVNSIFQICNLPPFGDWLSFGPILCFMKESQNC